METVKIELELTGNEAYLLQELIKTIGEAPVYNIGQIHLNSIFKKLEKEFSKQRITFFEEEKTPAPTGNRLTGEQK